MSRTIQRPVPPKIICQNGSVNMTMSSAIIRHLQIVLMNAGESNPKLTTTAIDDSNATGTNAIHENKLEVIRMILSVWG